MVLEKEKHHCERNKKLNTIQTRRVKDPPREPGHHLYSDDYISNICCFLTRAKIFLSSMKPLIILHAHFFPIRHMSEVPHSTPLNTSTPDGKTVSNCCSVKSFKSLL